MRWSPKGAGGFVLRVLFVYALLATPWPTVKDAYGTVFRAAGNALFGAFGSRGLTRFELLTERGRGMGDTKVTLRGRGSRFRGGFHYNSWFTGWLPVAAFAALALATPIPWSRRWKALFWGLGWIHLFVAFQVFLMILYGFCRSPGKALFEPGPFWTEVFHTGTRLLSITPVASLLLPIFVWLLVSFRRGDWELVVGRAGTEVETRPTA